MPPDNYETDGLIDRLRQVTDGEHHILALAELGRGGMAVVYLAHDISLDRKVAIKVMFPSLISFWESVRNYVGRDHGGTDDPPWGQGE